MKNAMVDLFYQHWETPCWPMSYMKYQMFESLNYNFLYFVDLEKHTIAGNQEQISTWLKGMNYFYL